jgi:UDP-N-acetylglucosamine transferase subunit ALG13
VTAPEAGQTEPADVPRVVVTVGTDHHPFDRLIGWTNDWLGRRPELVAAFFAQSGSTAVLPVCPASPFLPVGPLNALLDAADVIVCHGGPASIAAAWSRGQLPIVVPRVPELGEHVDDHQVDFCRKVAKLGRVRLAQTPAEFDALLDEATRDHSRFRARLPEADIDAAVARLGMLVGELVSQPRRRLPLIPRGRRNRRRPIIGTGAAADALSPGVIPEASTSWPEHGMSVRTGLAGRSNEEHE